MIKSSVASSRLKKPLGVYIHIPFCLQKCLYCDFCSYPDTTSELRDKYISSLCRQICEFEKADKYAVDTVYFGGGTPTLLSLSQLDRVFDALNKAFAVSPNTEITLECNPATGGYEYFSELFSMGVNRLSVGVQSADDRELSALGRIHKYSDAVKTILSAQKAGLENISADLMFGIPYQTRESFKKTLSSVVELGVCHISAYGLILEPGTPFFERQKKLALPDEDAEYEMYNDACSYLAKNGIFRYEISNFAMNGHMSRHNLKYWQHEDYLGFGVSAHSFFEGKRFSAPSDLNSYISGKTIDEFEEISDHDAAAEFIMLGMRLTCGIDENEFSRLFGISLESFCGSPLARFVKNGLITRENGRCRFSDKGFYVSNTVLSEILSFEK